LEEHRAQNDLAGLALLVRVQVLDVKIASIGSSVVDSEGSEGNVDVVELISELNFEGVSPQVGISSAGISEGASRSNAGVAQKIAGDLSVIDVKEQVGHLVPQV